VAGVTVYHVILAAFAVVSVASLVAVAVLIWRAEGAYDDGRWR
jgi:hypothetical protein